METIIVDNSMSLTPLTDLEHGVYAKTIDEGVLKGWSHMWEEVNPNEVLAWMSRFYEGTSFGIQIDGKPAGVRSIFRYHNQMPLCTGGWLSSDYRGKGYGKQALKSLIENRNVTQGHKLISTGTQKVNKAARGNLESCGFTPIEFYWYRNHEMVRYDYLIPSV